MRFELEGVCKRFGGLQALEDVSLAVQSGQVTAVVGPNGAGKSTLVNCLTGMFPIDSGSFAIDGASLGGIEPRQLIDFGITRTFQNIRLWDHLSVIEHVVLARLNYARSRRAGDFAKREDPHVAAERLLARAGLRDKARLRPNALSYGERRRLEIARGLATNPRLFLLDEPAAGFNLSEQARLAELIREIAAEGIAIILIEHHMDLIASVSSVVIVLNFGRVIATGSFAEIRENPQVISAYLGLAQ